MLSGLCAVVLLVTAVVPAASAQEPEGTGTTAVQTLSASDVKEMQQADAAVTALTDSTEFAEMSVEERTDAAQTQLDELVKQGLVQKGSIYRDEENGMVSFAYTCGAWGGILVADPEEEDSTADEPLMLTAEELALNEENGTYGNAVIYYAFDNTVNSSRYPNYAYMQNYWTSVGLDTKLDTTVTVSDLRRMGDYDLCVLSTHGAYYTYEYGWLQKKETTEPVLLLTEESTFWNDLRYGMDLLGHRVIKVNGAYAVTPGFFSANYRKGSLNDTVIISETCEFYGKSGHLDKSIADALVRAGAEAVVGYVNNVYSVYSRSMMWTMINRMLEGDTVGEAMDFALDRFGENDIVWYNEQGGRRPHAVASFPIITGEADARLKALGGRQSTQTVQEAA